MSNASKAEAVVKHYIMAIVPAETAAIADGHGSEAKHIAWAAALATFGPILGAFWDKYKDTKDAIIFMKAYKQLVAAQASAQAPVVAQAQAVAAANPVPAPEAPATPAS